MGTDEELTGPWLQTYTGKRFHFLDPSPDEICIEDIAHALSNQCRFAGHTVKFYSVAEHSCLVSRLAKPNELEGLLHDASEAYLMDLPSPVKRVFDNYRVVEEKVMQAVAQKFGFNWPMSKEVHVADNAQLIIEAENLLQKCEWIEAYRTTDVRGIIPRGLHPEEAEQYFLTKYERIVNGPK